MDIPDIAESWSSKISEVIIGATQAEGGTRSHTIAVGGAQSMPYMDFEGAPGNRTVVVMDVLDVPPKPGSWSEALAQAYQDVWDDPGAWAKKCVEEYGAEMICLLLEGCNPDKGDRTVEQAAAATEAVLAAVKVPIIIWGCGDDDKDNAIMPKASAAAKGERALIGPVSEDNYKTITALALADGHDLICRSPLDINIAKQVHILVSEMGFPLDRVVSFQATGALGYGMEYAYSIQERERIAALSGDKMMSVPTICDCGFESWKTKEAKTPEADAPEWGPEENRGIMWEIGTAVSLLQSGVDLCRVRHPKTAAVVRKYIADMMATA